MKAQGLRTKRNNLLVAALSGLILIVVSVRIFPPSFGEILAGLVVGLLYANAFEYCLHRFLLHSGIKFISGNHMVHHETLNTPDAARYVNFSRHPLGVVGLFAVNAIPVFFLEGITHTGWAAGIFATFALYYVAFEEIHWRTHMGGWLPKWLRPAARHHLLHHAQGDGRFNVFFPLLDWIVEALRPHSRMHREAGR